MNPSAARFARVRPGRRRIAALSLVVLAAAAPAARAQRPAWIEASDANSRYVLEQFSKFMPEMMASLGIEGMDGEIMDLGPGLDERVRAAGDQLLVELERRRAAETDPEVRVDLDILIDQARENRESSDLDRKLFLPYFSLAQTMYQSMAGLLDAQVAESRRPAAGVRLEKYTGRAAGHRPIVELAKDRVRERLGEAALLGPPRAEVERDLANSARFLDGIEQLFATHGLDGHAEALAALRTQIADWDAFVTAEILPRARTDFRLPPELYEFNLRYQVGVDMPIPELVSRAKTSFREIQNEMQAVAALVATEKGYGSSDYRDVIRELKKEQFEGEAILPHYRERIRELEALIRDNGVLTLPAREMQVRVATTAEAAAVPAPNMRPPRFIGNTGEQGTFILPLRVPGATGGGTVQFDDFTFRAASWTLTAHEGRPGHELQFASTVEKGVSLARGLFAMNSTNVEGWALYAEAEMKPYFPLDGQLIGLQHRLLRAARAFLDPSLQAGTITKDEAMRVLIVDVVVSPAMAQQEVDRYTFRSPGQAPSYFCGYQRFMELRADVERTLGPKFDRKAYHDFILGQGLLPLPLLRERVMEIFAAGGGAAGAPAPGGGGR
jgi:hypothetical protein